MSDTRRFTHRIIVKAYCHLLLEAYIIKSWETLYRDFAGGCIDLFVGQNILKRVVGCDIYAKMLCISLWRWPSVVFVFSGMHMKANSPCVSKGSGYFVVVTNLILMTIELHVTHLLPHMFNVSWSNPIQKTNPFLECQLMKDILTNNFVFSIAITYKYANTSHSISRKISLIIYFTDQWQ